MFLEGHLLFSLYQFLSLLHGSTKKQIYHINIRRLFTSVIKGGCEKFLFYLFISFI